MFIKMKTFIFPVLCSVLWMMSTVAKEFPAAVQVYSRAPAHPDVNNTLVCHVQGFHPPDIMVELLKNGAPILDANQTDLAFEDQWKYHLTKYAFFTPGKKDEYSCKVTHLGKSNIYAWEPDF